jgi:hypothetical protein
MALPILLLGDMGTGKSTSLRNLPPDQTIIIKPNSKDLPWEGAMDDYSPAKKNLFTTTLFHQNPDTKELGAWDIMQSVNKYAPQIKYLVLEDITHYMNARMMDDKFIRRDDWGKWNEFGADVFSIAVKDFETFRDDLTIIVIGHTEVKDNGQVGMLTAGKLLDNTVKVPSYFTYAFHARVFKTNNKLEYKFQTHNDGVHLAKTPMGCFAEDFIDNDMLAIAAQIREYRSRKRKPAAVANGDLPKTTEAVNQAPVTPATTQQ